MFFVLKKDYAVLAISFLLMLLIVFLFFNKTEFDEKTENMDKIINGTEPIEVLENKKTVVIDAGHGGFDPGAVSNNGVLEKDINLKIATKLKKCLEEKNYNVIMTRESDISLNESENSSHKKREDLNKRKNIVNESNADILISIHLNFFSDSSCSGMQTFYVEGSENGERLANVIQEEMKNILKPKKMREILPIKSIYILERTDVPSVVVECGFLSNPIDEANLKDDEYQNNIAYAIASGVERYFA